MFNKKTLRVPKLELSKTICNTAFSIFLRNHPIYIGSTSRQIRRSVGFSSQVGGGNYCPNDIASRVLPLGFSAFESPSTGTFLLFLLAFPSWFSTSSKAVPSLSLVLPLSRPTTAPTLSSSFSDSPWSRGGKQRTLLPSSCSHWFSTLDTLPIRQTTLHTLRPTSYPLSIRPSTPARHSVVTLPTRAPVYLSNHMVRGNRVCHGGQRGLTDGVISSKISGTQRMRGWVNWIHDECVRVRHALRIARTRNPPAPASFRRWFRWKPRLTGLVFNSGGWMSARAVGVVIELL